MSLFRGVGLSKGFCKIMFQNIITYDVFLFAWELMAWYNLCLLFFLALFRLHWKEHGNTHPGYWMWSKDSQQGTIRWCRLLSQLPISLRAKNCVSILRLWASGSSAFGASPIVVWKVWRDYEYQQWGRHRKSVRAKEVSIIKLKVDCNWLSQISHKEY